MDFAEFLHLMRWTLDKNFAGIKEQTDGAAARYRAECQAQQAAEMERQDAATVHRSKTKDVAKSIQRTLCNLSNMQGAGGRLSARASAPRKSQLVSLVEEG